jgi:ferredoxin
MSFSSSLLRQFSRHPSARIKTKLNIPTRSHNDDSHSIVKTLARLLDIDGRKAKLLISELNKTGIPSTQIPSFVDSMGKAGLQQFLEAVERSTKEENTPTIKIFIDVPKERHSFDVVGKVGHTLVDLADESELGMYIECVCGGLMACSTCHVILEESLFYKIEPPCEAEQDMLDLAYGYTNT